jgi:hypothetical protein
MIDNNKNNKNLYSAEMEIHERDCHLRLIAAFVDSAAA